MAMRNQNPKVLAQEFWSGTEGERLFPRNIEHAIAMKLPLALVRLSILTLQTVAQWLAGKHLAVPLPLNPHDFLGCLVAHRGHGIIFVCNTDEAEEQRLTVAHEVAHFLLDYLWPRRQIIQVLGEHMTDVLDGVRKATPAERAAAILSHVHLGAYIHLLPRPGIDEDADSVVAYTEARADQLALELVAPREQISSFLHGLSAREALHPHAVCVALAAHFSLPASAFDPIVRHTVEPRPVSFLEDVRATLRRQQCIASRQRCRRRFFMPM